MMIGSYQVVIKTEDRGDFGIYGKVFAKDLCECDAEWHHILTLAPGMKLSKEMFDFARKMAGI